MTGCIILNSVSMVGGKVSVVVRKSERWIITGSLLISLGAGCIGRIADPPSPAAEPEDEVRVDDDPGNVPGTPSGPGVVPEIETEPPPPPPSACSVDGIKAGFMPTLRITDDQYANVVRDLFNGLVAPATVFPPTSEIEGYTSNPDANIVSLLAAEEIMRAAEEAAVQISDNVAQLLPCATETADGACADQFIAEYGKRAFRRPVRDDEASDLRALFDKVRTDTPFDASIGIVAMAMLQMPQFLYVLERGEPTSSAGIVALDDYEIAQRLSLLFLGSLPDAALMEAADNGELGTVEGIEAQARRLLEDPRSVPAIVQFFREWLKVEPLEPGLKSDTVYPNFDFTLADSMNREFDEFVRHVLNDLDGRLSTLLTTNSAVVNRPLAEFYGLDPSVSASDEDWVVAELPGDERAGILSKPAVLATHAHQILTSPVFRGKVVRKQLLCTDIPPPPPDAMVRTPEFPDGANTRERSEILRGVDECGGCHELMDPIGLGFERYDAIGAFRELYPDGEQIDESGNVVGGVDVAEFMGLNDLSRQLSTADSVRACVPNQIFRFVYGRREGVRDICGIEQAIEQFAAADYDLRELMVALVTTDTFRFRTTAEDGE